MNPRSATLPQIGTAGDDIVSPHGGWTPQVSKNSEEKIRIFDIWNAGARGDVSNPAIPCCGQEMLVKHRIRSCDMAFES